MGELEGAAARLEWDRMPRKALPSKACGPRSGDFCTALRCKSNGIFYLYFWLSATANSSQRLL